MSCNKSLEERFWPKVDRSRGERACWLWTAAKTDQGYGSVKVNGRATLAHRVAYSLAGGDLTRARVLDHTCFNRACVNPRHLRSVTAKQNNEHLQGAQFNSKSGVRNVWWSRRAQKWVVRVTHNRQVHHGGFFTDLAAADDAATALRAALFSHDDYRPERVDAIDAEYERDGKAIARIAEFADSSTTCD